MKARKTIWEKWSAGTRGSWRTPIRRLQFQRLEARRVLDATAALTAGVLDIQADQAGGEVSVVEGQGTVTVQNGNEEIAAFAVDGVFSIYFQGGAGDDVFTNDTSLMSEVWGHDGNDTLQGGSNVDTIHGGEGDDQIFGGDGNDLLAGGAGDDILKGGNGDDSLYGESGQDTLYGESGADYLDGGSDCDTLTGGAGSDQMLVDPPGTSSLLADIITDAEEEDVLIDSSSVGAGDDPENGNGESTETLEDLILEALSE